MCALQTVTTQAMFKYASAFFKHRSAVLALATVPALVATSSNINSTINRSDLVIKDIAHIRANQDRGLYQEAQLERGRLFLRLGKSKHIAMSEKGNQVVYSKFGPDTHIARYFDRTTDDAYAQCKKDTLGFVYCLTQTNQNDYYNRLRLATNEYWTKYNQATPTHNVHFEGNTRIINDVKQALNK